MKKILSTLLLSSSLMGFGQVFSSGFETNYGPITNWTLYNVDGLTPASQVSFVNAAWIATTEEYGNNVAMSTSYYSPSGTSNDWIVSPAITLPAGTNTLYWHARSYDATYKESYKVYVSTTGNAVANFTTPILTVNGEDTTWQNKSVDLSAYSGQTIYLAFQNFSTDKFLGAIDNVYVVNGTAPQPGRLVTASNITKTSATFNWTAASGGTGYDYSWGAVGHVPSAMASVSGAATNTAIVSTLTPNTLYEYYLRSKNGTTNGGWIGPYRLYTATELGAGSYAYGFDNTAAGFYQNDGWTGAWSTNAGAGNPQAGTQMVFSNNSTAAATNRWLFSKPFNLTAGATYTITYYLRNFGSTTTAQSIKLTVGNAATTTAQTNTLWTSTTVANAAWTQYTVNFVPTASGTHYFAFNHFSPVQASSVSLGLDTFNINGVLGVNDVEAEKEQLSLYPNPAKDFVTIKTGSKINKVEIFDIAGRKLPANLDGNKIDVRNLAPGNYIINVETHKGKVSEKLIKK